MFRLWGNDLARRGILGMNARNGLYLTRLNPRVQYPLVDDKLLLAEFCQRLQVPTPEILGYFERHGDLRHLVYSLEACPECVIKPARGASGRGIIILTGRHPRGYLQNNGHYTTIDSLRRHCADILCGQYSLNGRNDRVLLQRRVKPHPSLENICFRGTPDIRVLVVRQQPVMAMLRLPTFESQGRANLHQGGIGVGIEMSSGRTFRAIHRGHMCDRHPDTGESLLDRAIPDWQQVLQIAAQTARVTGLGYLGADIILDEERGPLLLEANARPGLGIQSANGIGLLKVLESLSR